MNANIVNSGRGAAFDPVVLLGSSKESILPISNVIYSAVTIEKEITLMDANTYDDQTDDDLLAIAFIKQGMKKVPFIPGRGDGKAFMVGFAFEDGAYFYGASDASAGLARQPLGKGEWTYLHFSIYARNNSKKQLKKNLRTTFIDWDKVNIEYRVLPIPPLEETMASKNTPKESPSPSQESSPASSSSAPSQEPSPTPP